MIIWPLFILFGHIFIFFGTFDDDDGGCGVYLIKTDLSYQQPSFSRIDFFWASSSKRKGDFQLQKLQSNWLGE